MFMLNTQRESNLWMVPEPPNLWKVHLVIYIKKIVCGAAIAIAAPTILWYWVQIPSRPSMLLFHFEYVVLYLSS